MKKILAICFLFFVCIITLQAQDTLTKTDIPPLFQGCDDPLISEDQRQACSVPKIQAFINQNIVYPDSAREKGVEGVVVVRFVVTEEGKITSPELIRNIGAGCGAEALRVVGMMPDFRPALKNGKPVETKMTLPIRFKKINEAQAHNKNLYQIHWGTTYGNRITKDELSKLLKHPLIIRDYYGNLYDINFLTLRIKTKSNETDVEGKGNNLNGKMTKALKKIRPKQKLIFIATIQKDYQDIEITRELEVVK